MRCECRNAVREERQRIADYLDNRGQRWVADRSMAPARSRIPSRKASA